MSVSIKKCTRLRLGDLRIIDRKDLMKIIDSIKRA